MFRYKKLATGKLAVGDLCLPAAKVMASWGGSVSHTWRL